MQTRFRNLKRWPFATVLAARNYGYSNVVAPSGAQMGSKLCMAVLRKDNQEVKELLMRGAPLDYHDDPDGWTPLIYSIYYHNPAARELLLVRGASPDIADYAGRTPLMIAAVVGDLNFIKRLLGMGVSALATDYRQKTAMDFAAEYRNYECLNLLNSYKCREQFNNPGEKNGK